MPSINEMSTVEGYQLFKSNSIKPILIPESESAPPRTEPPRLLERTESSSLPKLHRPTIGPRRTSRTPISSPSLRPILKRDDEDDDPCVDSLQHALFSKVSEWVQEERRKMTCNVTQNHVHFDSDNFSSNLRKSQHSKLLAVHEPEQNGLPSMDLDKLERILAEYASIVPKDGDNYHVNPARRHLKKRPSTLLKLNSGIASSDTDYSDFDDLVPSAEVVLDNSKTMSYNSGSSESLGAMTKRSMRERENWKSFKNEIVRLAHTLKLKGWRRVPLEQGEEIDVERLSGALTNAVYVVSPPKHLYAVKVGTGDNATMLSPKKAPSKLLLRIYGPQASHLIDRENELQILRRLGRKKIGPRLLGTFKNGRFEEFFHARPLTARDLRVPETSIQIAKRMRELHDCIELLDEEREAGPSTWRNWDKWVDRCEEVISWLDNEILNPSPSIKPSHMESWRTRGLVCGVPWSAFRDAVERYRKWLEKQYGGFDGIRSHLVFAHNDTQYGNLLRLQPSGESPLLLPANEHKQLIVIDFEYASANVPGLEFANHFTEWCYNYHDEERPYACNEKRYPTPEEQKRFFRAYLQHKPRLPRSFSTPATPASAGPSGSISAFMLDSRKPVSQQFEEEQLQERILEEKMQHLSRETRLWRVANSAQWVAWGIVQAKVEGMTEALAKERRDLSRSNSRTSMPEQVIPMSDPLEDENKSMTEKVRRKRSESLSKEVIKDGVAAELADREPESPIDEEGNEEFDYLGYAQDRAMFFWGDLVALGVMKREEFPLELLPKLKIVPY